MFHIIYQVTKELSIHCDEVVNALAALNRTRIENYENSYSHNSESAASVNDSKGMFLFYFIFFTISYKKNHFKDTAGYIPGSFAAKSRAKIVATALTNSFDHSVAQIVEWLEMEREMLKKHCIVVGDYDMILESISKQKVSW